MSVAATTWAWNLELRPHLKLVLVAYCDYAGDGGTSIHPSVASIAAKTGYSTRRVQQITRELEERGLLVLEGEHIPKGRPDRAVNLFRVPLEASPRSGVKNGERGEKISPRKAERGETQFASGVKPSSPNPLVEPPEHQHQHLRQAALLALPPVCVSSTDGNGTGPPARTLPSSTTAEKRAERDALLQHLEAFAEGFAEAWEGWRCALPTHKKWTLWAEVLKLRRFSERCGRRSPGELLSQVEVATEGGWRDLKEEWWEDAKPRGAASRVEPPRIPAGAISPDGSRCMGEDGQWHRVEGAS